MEREIKFRAWLPKEKRIILIGDRHNDTGLWISEEWFDVVDHFTGMAEILGSKDDGVILMQFTGLKDKNGKEIWEGDIISNGYGVGVIKWDKTSCAFRLFWNATILDDDVSWIPFKGMKYNEIIGNIYENPELLSPNN